jgi:hypothetical protein
VRRFPPIRHYAGMYMQGGTLKPLPPCFFYADWLSASSESCTSGQCRHSYKSETSSRSAEAISGQSAHRIRYCRVSHCSTFVQDGTANCFQDGFFSCPLPCAIQRPDIRGIGPVYYPVSAIQEGVSRARAEYSLLWACQHQRYRVA